MPHAVLALIALNCQHESANFTPTNLTHAFSDSVLGVEVD
jgi:hypothetical protein